jgi:hypothetical protein
MPIYEYYCPENHTIYQFYAKTLAQGKTVPPCPENPRFHLVKMMSSFAVTGTSAKKDGQLGAGEGPAGAPSADEARMEAAMGAMEREFSNVDESDPRAMGRMMRRMAELSGQKLDGQAEEVVRRLEEGADPDELEEQLGGEAACQMPDPDGPFGARGEIGSGGERRRARRAGPMLRDPKLYDYP